MLRSTRPRIEALRRRYEMSDRPLLLRLAVGQHPGQGPEVRYDEAADELMVRTGSGWVPAIDSPEGSPMTKKRDIEKGEDSKDRW